jgi:hypothetical protein
MGLDMYAMVTTTQPENRSISKTKKLSSFITGASIQTCMAGWKNFT